MRISGICKHIIYFNSQYASSSFFLKPNIEIEKEKLTVQNEVKCVGKYFLSQKNLPIALDGEWKQDESGLWEFHFKDVCPFCLTQKEALDFIGSKKRQVSERELKKVLDQTGPDIFSASKDPEMIDRICKTGKVDEMAVAEVLFAAKSVCEEHETFKLMEKYGGTYENGVKILKKYPDSAAQVIMKNPYSLYENLKVPFSLVDKIALDNGYEELSEARIKAILLWTIRQEKNSGNVYMTFDDITRRIKKKFNLPSNAIAAYLSDHPYIVKDENRDAYYERTLLEDEKKAAMELIRLICTKKTIPFHPEYITKLEEKSGRKLGSQQRESFQLQTSTGPKILTGGPGTGKTTTLDQHLQYAEITWEKEFGYKPKILLCAPSGRASQRMKETTGRNAQTVHKALNVMPYGDSEYYKDADDPLDADIIVVDETSMLGLSIFSKLLTAIKSGSMVIFVGDTNQLPSVDPGSVLADLIRSDMIDSCNLTEVFRQAKESYINVNANKIICGDENLLEGPDFQMIPSNPDETEGLMVSEVNELIREAGDKNRVQVLAPVKKGSCGVTRANDILQDIFNPGRPLAVHGGRKYRVGDRVIMMSNNYALNYFNGDVGYIKSINDYGMKIEISEDNTISLPKDLYGDMDLAYSCTIHKSQGSEYDYLLIVLQQDAGGMLDRNLFYTGVTRGKKKVVVLYEEGTIEKSIRTKNSNKRKSLLVERMYDCAV